MVLSCADKEILVRNAGFLSAVTLQAIAGYGSAIISTIVAIKCRNLHFHINWRILITTSLVMYVVHSIVIAALQTTHLIEYLTNSKPCNIGLPPLVCFWLRYPASSCMVCFAALQLSMALERAVALWKSQRYESYGPKLGIISAFFSVVVSFATVAWVVRDADIAPRGFYCSSVTGKTAHRITLLSYLLCAINMITLIAIIFLNIFNKFAMTWFTKSFSLQSYQLCENASAIRVMLPLNVFQIMSYLLFSIGAAAIVIMRSQLSVITFQTLITSVYVIPFYNLISPILIWFVIRWSKQMKAMKLQNLKQKMEEEREIHFLELGRIWNDVTVNK